MAYATVQDMIDRFGAPEMIRLSTPDDRDMDGVVTDRVERALELVSSTMDSYIRKRYATPLDVAPPEVTSKCCDMARYELACGDGKSPTTDMDKRNDVAMRWLRDIAAGAVTLDLDEVAIGEESFSQVSIRGDGSRDAPFGRGGF